VLLHLFCIVKVSVVIPVYFNEGSILKTYEKVNFQLSNHNDVSSFELIIIDDGSLDGSFNEMLEVKKSSPNIVRIIKFTRNFGQLAAMNAGYKISTGDCVINISADLQDPPELINQMIDCFAARESEIVICTRLNREDGWYRKFTSLIFYKTMRILTFENMPQGGFDFVLLSRRAVDFLLSNNESNAFWQGKILWSGFATKYIPYLRKERATGVSRWSFRKKLKYFLDGIFAYSYFPVRLMSFLGIGSFLSGFIYAIIITLNYFIGDIPFKGWAPLMILILVLSGLQMLMLGFVGEYLWRTLDQVRGRPEYVIESIDD
jgi:glycosyltransferase involved in cell wall biosynthesis